jgi:heat shock protein beta
VEAMASGADLSLIGQFGVGFYSDYLVADRVRVTSKHVDDEQHVWESTADSTFAVAEDPRGNTLGRGTEVTLFLKEDASEFLDQDTLKELIKKYSEFITFPIYLHTSRTESVEVPVEEEDEEVDDALDIDSEDSIDSDDEMQESDEEEEEELEIEEEEDDDDLDDKPKTRTEQRTVWEWTLINEQKAIWARNKDDITDEEYHNFYKAITKDAEDPSVWSHFKAEGEIEFRSILYVPTKAPFDLFENYYGKSGSLRLYVRKVLIADEFEDLMPRYLNFIKGVVDSDDLPLNVSRETLQQNKILKVMGKKLVRKALEMLRKLAESSAVDAEVEGDVENEDEIAEKKDAYIEFWKEFGKNVKLGLIEDASNRTKLSKLLRFKSSHSDGEFISLADYIGRMKDTQKYIYYLAGENIESVESSTFLAKFRKKELEVLFLVDPIDEYAIQNLSEYDGKKLMSITKEGIKFGDEEDVDTRREEIYQEQYTGLIDWMQEVYGERVEKVVVSNRLTDAPCVIVTSQFGYTANMERIMRSQAFSDPKRMQYMVSRKIMEINPRHPIVSDLKKRVDDDAADDDTENVAFLLYDAAMVDSGFPLDPQDFASRVHGLMRSGLSLESLDLLPEIDVAEIDEEEEEEDEEEEEEEDEEEEEEEVHDEL